MNPFWGSVKLVTWTPLNNEGPLAFSFLSYFSEKRNVLSFCQIFDIIYFEADIILVWCMRFQFRFLWLRKWLPNWFAGTRFIKVIALCWSQGNWQSRKVSFSVIFLFVAMLQIYYIKIYVNVPSQARLCNSVWVLSMWFVYNATATLVKVIYKSTFCPW